MLIFNYRNGPFKITEGIGKDDASGKSKADSDVLLTMELLLESEIPILKGHFRRFELNIPNYVIELRQSEEVIFKKIHKSTRSDIRKAQKNERFTYHEILQPTDKDIQEFSLLYDGFAHEKKIARCNTEKLRSIRDANALVMTGMKDEYGETLCASMLVVDRECSQLYGLYGVSTRLAQTSQENKSLIARANKLLQWKEIQLAKKMELDWYNFGGEVSQEDQGVNDFKRRFGTIQAIDRRTYTAASLLGSICTALLYLKWKAYTAKTRKQREKIKYRSEQDGFHIHS